MTYADPGEPLVSSAGLPYSPPVVFVLSDSPPPPPLHRALRREWENEAMQKWFQVLGVILIFLLAMAILRYGINCLIDVAVLRDTESLMRQVSQVRRWFCPWWHPRTQPQQQQHPLQSEEEGRISPQRSSQRDEALDRVLAGLMPSEKRELLASLLKSQVASEEDLMQWKQENKDKASLDNRKDLERFDSARSASSDDQFDDNIDSDDQHEIHSARSSSQRSNLSLLCSICIHDLELGNPIISLSSTCQHRFHTHCLVQWLSTHTHRDCPYCRTEILTPDMLHQAYRQRQDRQRVLQQQHQDVNNNACSVNSFEEDHGQE